MKAKETLKIGRKNVLKEKEEKVWKTSYQENELKKERKKAEILQIRTKFIKLKNKTKWMYKQKTFNFYKTE